MSILMTPAYLAATTIPLHHARIGWENLARLAVITASSTDSAEAFAQAPISDQTWQWWQATMLPATWAAEFSTPQVINYCGIGAHEIGSAGATVHVEYLTGGVWNDVPDAIMTPADDSAILIIFEDITCDGMRIRLTGAGGPPRISIIHFGAILEMARPVRWMGHTPTRFQRDFTKRPNTSERGQRLGTSLIRQGLSGSFSVANISEAWARAVFDLFIVNSMRYGYFISWRPDQFPNEVYFGWTDRPIVPTNSQGGTTRLMSVNWDAEFHNPENVTAWES